ncbi:UNVERIFIED_CONTAM: hypothetical protein K2H54_005453 [Gekko kuhli]
MSVYKQCYWMCLPFPTDLEKDLYLYQTELEADIEKMEKLYKVSDRKPPKSTAGSAPLETFLDHSPQKKCNELHLQWAGLFGKGEVAPRDTPSAHVG